MLAGDGYDEEAKYHLYLVRAKKKKGKKTNTYIIRRDSMSACAERLGLIKWHGAFRQFAFYPDSDTFWSKGCLEIVNRWLDDKNKRHRNKLKRSEKK